MSKVQDPLIHALELEAQVRDEEVNHLPRCHHNSITTEGRNNPTCEGPFRMGNGNLSVMSVLHQ